MTFTEKELIAFANYCLSKERMMKTSKEIRHLVNDADVHNFKLEIGKIDK